MLTWIVAHSDALCNFLTPLLIDFSPAQLRHALNCVEALLVCTSKHKTLSALTRITPLLKDAKAQLQPTSEVLRDHQREHVRQTVRCIADLVRQGHSDDELLDLLVPD